MARIGQVRDRQEFGGKGPASPRDARTLAIIGVAAAVLIGVGGWWWASSNAGVELTRGSEEVEEPLDPDAVQDAEAAVGEADGEAPSTDGENGGEPAPTTVKVHVDGAVLVAGVYELYGADPRVADAVAAAGGLSDGADTSAVNLAAPVGDGDKIHIPTVEENATALPGVGEIPAGSSTNASASPSSVATSSGGTSPTGPINVNTASAEELTALPGVGEKTAEKIVADREAQGPFASPEDLMRVSGIGEKKFAQIKDLICV